MHFVIPVIFLLFASFFVGRFKVLPVSDLIFHEIVILIMGIGPAALLIHFRHEIPLLRGLKTQQAIRFDKLKDDFLTVASHELRTPLSVINGFAEILVREKIGPLNDEQKRRIRKILMQGQRLSRIIDELLDMSRIRSGKISVKEEIFDLIPVLKASIDDQQIICEQQRISLSDNLPDVLPDVSADLERVTQVIINLLGNAVKYTPAGGAVSISASYDSDRSEVRVDVKDTGIGIKIEDQVHVFDEFFRATSQTGGKYKGSGLGLSIVKQLVDAQKGRVGVYSEGIDKGSLFFFTLPAAKV